MDPKDRHVGRDDRLADEGGEDRGVVADVTFATGNRTPTDNRRDTLNDVVFPPSRLSGQRKV